MARYYYNGVLLPEIPSETLSKYPYVFIFYRDDIANYRMYTSSVVPYWYPTTDYPMTMKADGTLAMYHLSDNGEEWIWIKDETSMYTLATNGITWSNYDIPNGSATATEIYFYGSEPVPEFPEEPDEPEIPDIPDTPVSDVIKVIVDRADLVAVADAIRQKAGIDTELTLPGGFVKAVEGISGGTALQDVEEVAF